MTKFAFPCMLGMYFWWQADEILVAVGSGRKVARRRFGHEAFDGADEGDAVRG